MKKIFIDTEFTGLHKQSTLISLALVAESGEAFYAEFNDYDKGQLNEWLTTNVIDKLVLQPGDCFNNYAAYNIYDNRHNIAQAILKWIAQFGDKENSIQIWGDCPAWDWVLFNDLFGYDKHYIPRLPRQIHYIPMDLAVLACLKGLEPDFNRFQFVKELLPNADIDKQHNALVDARVLQLCYNKIMKEA